MTLIKLRKLAEATTKGSWYTELNIAPRIGSSVDAAFIAAANPAAVISLLDQIQTLQAENERLNESLLEHRKRSHEAEQAYLAVVPEPQAERDALAAKLEVLLAATEVVAIDAAKGGQPTVLKPFTPCVCHNDTAKLYCKNKGKCSHFVAQEGRPA